MVIGEGFLGGQYGVGGSGTWWTTGVGGLVVLCGLQVWVG